MRILKEESIGLVIDIQERLLPHVFHNQELMQTTEVLIQGLQILGIPVVLTEQYTKGLGPTVTAIKNLIPDFNPVEKMTFSCCDELNFTSALESSEKKNVIICGIESHVCVLQTAIDLREEGYVPIIVEDCVSSRKEKDKEIALKRMAAEGAIITSCESILFELARVSGTETFKAISKLVK